ncbi:C4-dicarboxylate ABC transporter [Neobacillus massiliamazoniensis]|jgi:hypothetical protein|uniref:C4-dicarboxylate ABC transporter n=1 Tax=Neobacillus massiliamazoniensis TaxID=1499688 RepID=A0A0U1NSP1_9BACI|nr:C4-dicarboxylate ABC transporter [Neobacillus massiliamazoniensis]CRK81080.1 hypothetical protein BN000_00978 [Neobacillus massiliamazoniensis]
MSDLTGKILGWIAIVVGVVGFFVAPVWLGAIGIILGLITLGSPQKVLGWVAVVIGVIVLLVQFFS